MKVFDLAIIGSGIGGSLVASQNKDKNIVVFEKDSNLGGCASTFKRFGSYFNTGATTFVGYEENHVIKKMFDKINFIPNIEESKIAIRTVQNGAILDRTKDFEKFIEDLEKVYPNKNNRKFWTKIKEIDEKFWHIKRVYFEKHSIKSYFKSLVTLKELFFIFDKNLLKSAESFIEENLGTISIEYKNFIDAQLLITIQCKIKDASLLSMALGLSYPFHKVFYANGGMGKIIEGLLEGVNVQKNEEVINILKDNSLFQIKTNKGDYLAKKVVLNSTVYDSSKLFVDKKIKKYYDGFSFSDQSAFVVYLKLNVKIEFIEHYQIILENIIPNTISNSFFVSFSKVEDELLSEGGLSVTISTHTKAQFWKDLSKENYEKQKWITQEYILEHFLNYFDNIDFKDIKKVFSGTSKTFDRFIGRLNCGGKPINIHTIFQTPSCNTPFDGLFNVGDTVFAGQGWPGVALGADILNRKINEKL